MCFHYSSRDHTHVYTLVCITLYEAFSIFVCCDWQTVKCPFITIVDCDIAQCYCWFNWLPPECFDLCVCIPFNSGLVFRAMNLNRKLTIFIFIEIVLTPCTRFKWLWIKMKTASKNACSVMTFGWCSNATAIAFNDNRLWFWQFSSEYFVSVVDCIALS